MLVLMGERTFLKGLLNTVFFFSLIGNDLTTFVELSSMFDRSPTQVISKVSNQLDQDYQKNGRKYM